MMAHLRDNIWLQILQVHFVSFLEDSWDIDPLIQQVNCIKILSVVELFIHATNSCLFTVCQVLG